MGYRLRAWQTYSTNGVTSPALIVIFLKVLHKSSKMRISTPGNGCEIGGGKAASQEVHGERTAGNPASRFQAEALAGSVNIQVLTLSTCL